MIQELYRTEKMESGTEIKEEIKRKIFISDLVGEYVALKKKGTKYWGLCPFHTEKTPSFTVSPDKEMYYCFGCHKHGDIFTFIMEMEKVSFPEALKILAQKAHIPLSFEYNKEKESRKELLLELYNRLTMSFHHLLLNSENARHARSYLEERGVKPGIISTFQLGYAPGDRNWLMNFLKKKNYSEEFMETSGLFTRRNNELVPYFYYRIIFPIKNTRGQVIAYGGRRLSEGGPKYLNSPETLIFKKGNTLFNLDQALISAKESHSIYLVEGYMDVLSLFQAGITNCVAPLGTAFTENQAGILKRYADKVILFFDGDEAGEKAALRAIEICESKGIESGVVEPQEGLDPDDILQKHGINGLKKIIEYPINSFRYLLNRAFLKFNRETPKGKENIFNFIFPYLKRIDSQIKRDGYLSILAESLKVDFKSVWKDFQNQNRFMEVKEENPAKKNSFFESISEELFLMLALTANRDSFAGVRCDLALDHLTDPFAREIYIALEENFREGTTSLESLMEKIENEELSSLIAEKNTSSEFSYHPEKLISDGVLRIKRRLLLKKREEISFLINKYEKSEPWKMKDLLVEKMILDKEYEEIRKNKDV
ncbi:MAG: DNA primase [Spirochaetales bacterium]|nr:DNA primase [Spirochaetales bacterium]